MTGLTYWGTSFYLSWRMLKKPKRENWSTTDKLFCFMLSYGEEVLYIKMEETEAD